MWICWSMLRKQGWEEHWETPRPRCATATLAQSCAASQPAPVSSHCSCCIICSSEVPMCCQDSGFLSQQHLLIVEPVAHPRFPSAQWLWPQVDFWLRTRLELLLCFLCKLTLQLLPRWNIHVPRHPSSLCRDWRCVWIQQCCEYCSLH